MSGTGRPAGSASLLPPGLSHSGPQFDFEKLRQAIAFVANGAGDERARQSATEYIADVRRGDAGWMASINLLKLDMDHPANVHELQWASQTMEEKVNEDLQRLAKHLWPNVRDMLLTGLMRGFAARNGEGLQIVVRPLASAMAALASRWEGWTGVVDSLRTAIAAKVAKGSSAPSHAGAPSLPAGQAILVSILAELPNARERSHRLGAIERPRFALLHDEFVAARTNVVQLLDSVLVSSGGKPLAILSAFECLAEWMRAKLIGAIDIAPPSRLATAAFKVLHARGMDPTPIPSLSSSPSPSTPKPSPFSRLAAMDGVMHAARQLAEAVVERVSDEAIVHLRRSVAPGGSAAAGDAPAPDDFRGPEGLLRVLVNDVVLCADVAERCHARGDEQGNWVMARVVSLAADACGRVLMRPHGVHYGGLLAALVRCTGCGDADAAECCVHAWGEVSRTVLGRAAAGFEDDSDNDEDEDFEDGELGPGDGDSGHGEGKDKVTGEDSPIAPRLPPPVQTMVKRAYHELVTVVLSAIEFPAGFEDQPDDLQNQFRMDWRYKVCALLEDACSVCGTVAVAGRLMQQLDGQQKAYQETKGAGRLGKPARMLATRTVGTWQGVEAALYAFRGISTRVPLSMIPMVQRIMTRLPTYPRTPDTVATMSRLITRYRQHIVRIGGLPQTCFGLLQWAASHLAPEFSVQASVAMGMLAEEGAHLLPEAQLGALMNAAHGAASPKFRETALMRLAVAAAARPGEGASHGGLMMAVAPIAKRLSAAVSEAGGATPMHIVAALTDLQACFDHPLAIEAQRVRDRSRAAIADSPVIAARLAQGTAGPADGVAPGTVLEIADLRLPPVPPSGNTLGGWTGQEAGSPAPAADVKRAVRTVLDRLGPLLAQVLVRYRGNGRVLKETLLAVSHIFRGQRPCALGMVAPIGPVLTGAFGAGEDQCLLDAIEVMLATCTSRCRPEDVSDATLGSVEMLAYGGVAAVTNRVLGPAGAPDAEVHMRMRDEADTLFTALRVMGTAARVASVRLLGWPHLPRVLQLACRAMPEVNLDVAVQSCRAIAGVLEACYVRERATRGPGGGAVRPRAGMEAVVGLVGSMGPSIMKAGMEAALVTMPSRVIESSSGSVSVMIGNLRRALGDHEAMRHVQSAIGACVPGGAVPEAVRGEIMRSLASDRLRHVDDALYRLRRIREQASGTRHRVGLGSGGIGQGLGARVGAGAGSKSGAPGAWAGSGSVGGSGAVSPWHS